MLEQNVYHQMKETIRTLNEFLDGNTEAVRSGIQTVASLVPQTKHLVDSLIYLMEQLRTTIATLDAASLPHLRELSHFSGQVNEMVHTVMPLLPNEPYTIDDVERSTRALGDLPSLVEVKDDILASLDGVIRHLYELRT